MSYDAGTKQDKNPQTINRAYENLAIAIIDRAAEDYRRLLRQGKADIENVDVVKFFNSEWFTMLTNIDGKRLMKLIEKEMEQ